MRLKCLNKQLKFASEIEFESEVINGLVVKALNSQSRGFVFKITGWHQNRLSLSSFRGRPNDYQEYLGT